MVRGLPQEFAKLGFKKGWKEYKASLRKIKKKKTRVKSSTKKKKGGRKKVAKKKKNYRRGFNIMPTVFKFARLGSLLGTLAIYYRQRSGDTLNKVSRTVMAMGGINAADKFDSKLLLSIWSPFILTTAITALIPRINGFVKRLTRF